MKTFRSCSNAMCWDSAVRSRGCSGHRKGGFTCFTLLAVLRRNAFDQSCALLGTSVQSRHHFPSRLTAMFSRLRSSTIVLRERHLQACPLLCVPEVFFQKPSMDISQTFASNGNKGTYLNTAVFFVCVGILNLLSIGLYFNTKEEPRRQKGVSLSLALLRLEWGLIPYFPILTWSLVAIS